ncbi:MAG: hypothetical protein FD123_924 [Bacteroidetes bacterium]|nr:MAG: hypothetical protein FD123_924 [Bacteroidota bacterium]
MKNLALLPLFALPVLLSCNGEEKKETKLLADAGAPVFDSLLIIRDTADANLFKHNEASVGVFRELYRDLSAAAKLDKPLRILHYGDSQIEADRITGAFRNKVQERFGGFGAGLLPVSEVSEARVNVIREYSDNWEHYDLRLKKNKEVPDNCFGYACTVHRFSSLAKNAGSNTYLESWLKLKSNSQSRLNERKAEHISIFYRNMFDNASYTIQSDTALLAQGELVKSNGFSVIRTKLPATDLGKLQVTLSATQSPDIFGISLDAANGVSVDNISLRGSSAIEFTNMDTLFLREQLAGINARLLIFQFGTNLVPNIVKDYSYYEELFYKQLAMFRRIAPNTAIVVIGVPDMARKVKGKYVSYPNIEKVLAAQERAADRAGCAFWNLYKIMGGQNAMSTWVKNGLANRDYTHFSNKGAEHVGTLLFDALIKDYERFNRQEKDLGKKQLATR